MSRRILIFTVLVVLVSITIGVASRLDRQQLRFAQSSTQPQQPLTQQRQRPKISKQDRQKHARKISEGLGKPGDAKISKSVDSGLTPVGRGTGIPVLTPHSMSDLFRPNNCEADAIVIGLVQTQSSSATKDDTFAYTRYKLAVSEVLKNNSEAPIEQGGQIVIDRTGGQLMVKGVPVNLIDPTSRPLEIGRTYLLFLTFLPEGIYASDNLSFLLSNNRVVSMSDALNLRKLDIADAAEFVQAVRLAAGEQCEGGAQ